MLIQEYTVKVSARILADLGVFLAEVRSGRLIKFELEINDTGSFFCASLSLTAGPT